MNNEKSKKTGKFGSAEQTFTHPKNATTRPQQINVPRVQNVLLVWLKNNIDDNSVDCRDTITELRQVVNDLKTFTNVDECVHFLTDIYTEKVCIIISDLLFRNIIPLIHEITQFHNIFIFCTNSIKHEQCMKEWSKIKGVFTDVSLICKVLKQVTHQCEENAISISFVGTSNDISKKNLNQLDPIFMYSQILKEILLTIKFDEKHVQQYTDYCRDIFVDNNAELKKVDRLQTEYHRETPIWWYTWESFLYPMLNRALRLMDIDIIIKMGFFISDLHRHVEKLHSEQFSGNNSTEIFTVYRGQGMSKTDFDKMRKISGGLMSFNNFLSTSKNFQVSLIFAESCEANPDLVGILFIITIDPTKSTTPFASIVDVGYYGDQEDEVLFSMHTVFRIGEITPMDENSRLFQVKLTLNIDNDIDLRLLTDRIREETYPEEEGWRRLGLLLLKVGESVKAQQVYEILLKQTTDVSEKGGFLHQLGWTKYKQGEYKEAIAFYQKALEIQEQTLSATHLSLANSYNNVGLVNSKMGNYSKALSSFEKALEIRKQSRPLNHPDLGMSYNNIGNLYYSIGDYRKALLSHEKALAIRQQSLPPNHPDLGVSYNNIGNVYKNMGDYQKALSSHEKALEIKQQSLPPNHPSLGTSYNSSSNVYFRIGDYPKALSHYEKDLEIKQQSLPPKHPSLGTSYNNIGLAYKNMGDHSKALWYYEKDLEIKRQSLPSNHPDLRSSYNNIGNVYSKMGDYTKARFFYERAVKIDQHPLRTKHSRLRRLERNVDSVKNKS